MIPPLRRIQLLDGQSEVGWMAPGGGASGRVHAGVPGLGLLEWVAAGPDVANAGGFSGHIYNKLRRGARAAGARCAAAKLCNHLGEIR
jgi:hypothetical protein